MEIDRYKPTYHPPLKPSDNGAIEGRFRVPEGVVEIFTYPGDQQTRAFTALEMWIYPHVYHAKIGRQYHARWLGRIARDFAWKCGQASKAKT